MVRVFLVFLVGLTAVVASCAKNQTMPEPSYSFLRTFKGVAVFCTDYTSDGVIGFIEDGTLRNEWAVAHRDSRLRWDSNDKRLYVIQRLGADSFFWLDGVDGKRSKEISAQRGKNLQDIALGRDGTVWATAYHSDKVVRVDLANGQELESKTLPNLDADGQAEATEILSIPSGYLVPMQKLTAFEPRVGSSWFYWNKDSREGRSEALRFSNPVTAFKRLGTELYIAGAGRLQRGRVLDGGIEALVLGQRGPEEAGRVVVTEQELGGDLQDFAFAHESLGVALVSAPESMLVAFDPKRGGIVRSLNAVRSAEFSWSQIVWLEEARRFLVLDRKLSRIRVWNQDLIEQESEAIALPMPPAHLVSMGSWEDI